MSQPMIHKENDGQSTPLQRPRPPPPKSEGTAASRNFGTPLSNCSSVNNGSMYTVDLTASHKKHHQRPASSSKKMVRARKILHQHQLQQLQEHKSPIAEEPPTLLMTQQHQNQPPLLSKQATDYTIRFLPGSIGLQLEPVQCYTEQEGGRRIGCRVHRFVDRGKNDPGQARKSEQIQLGDVVVQIDETNVLEMDYSKTIDLLKELVHEPTRQVTFRRYTDITATTGSARGPTPASTATMTSPAAAVKMFAPIVSPPNKHDDDDVDSKESDNVTLPTANGNARSPSPVIDIATCQIVKSVKRNPTPPTCLSPATYNNDKDLNSEDHVVINLSFESSVDSSSNLSPSHVKSLSQEDLELGMTSPTSFFTSRNNNDLQQSSNVDRQRQNDGNNGRKANQLFRQVYSSFVGVPTVMATSSLATKLGESLRKTISLDDEIMEERLRNKSQLVHELSHVSSRVTSARSVADATDNSSTCNDDSREPCDSVSDEKALSLWQEEKAILEQRLAVAEETLKQMEGHEEARADLEQRLMEANARIEETETHQRVLAAHTEATTQVQLCNQTEFERRLQEAQAQVEELAKQKEEANLSLLAMVSEVRQLETDREKERADVEANQLETKRQVEKLELELQVERNDRERLASKVAQESSQMKEIQEQLEQTQKLLGTKTQELQRTTRLVDQYEEQFMERANEADVLQEEKEFAGRELEYARKQVEQLNKRIQELETSSKGNSTLPSDELSLTVQELRSQLVIKEKSLETTSMELTKAQNDCEALLQQVAAFQHMLETAKSESEGLNQTTAMTQKELNDLTAAKMAIETQLEASRKELHEWRESYENGAVRERGLEKALAERDTQLATLQAEIQVISVKPAKAQACDNGERDHNLVEEISVLKAKIAAADETKKALHKEIADLKEMANGLYSEKSRITKELQSTKVELSESNVQATKMQDQLLQRAKILDSKAKEAQHDLKRKDAELSAALGKLERSNVKVDSLMMEVDRLEASWQRSSHHAKVLEEERDQFARRESALKLEMEEREREKQLHIGTARDAKSQLFEATSAISKLERQIGSIESSKTMLEQDLESMKEDNDALEIKLQCVREELDQKSNELSASRMEIMSLQNTNDFLRDDIQHKVEELESAQASIVTAQAQYSQLSEQFSKTAEEAANEKQALATQLIAAQDEILDSATKCTKLERQLVSLKLRNTECEEQLLAIRSQLEAEKDRATELETTAEATKTNLDAKIKSLMDDLSKCHLHLHQVEAECDMLSKDNGQLQLQVGALDKKLLNSRTLFSQEQNKAKKEKKDLEAQWSAQKDECTCLSDKLHVTSSELDRLRSQLASTKRSHDEQISSLRSEAEAKAKKMSEYLQQKDKELREMAQLQEELNVAKLDLQRLEDSHRRLGEENEIINDAIDELRKEHLAQVDDLTKTHLNELSRLTSAKDELEAAIRKGEGYHNKLKERLSDKEHALVREREKNDCLVTEKEALLEALRRAEDLIADTRCELQLLREEQANESIDSVDSQTLALSKSELRMKCKYLTEEVQEAEVRAATAKSEVVQRSNRIKSLEKDLNALSEEMDRLIQTNELLDESLVKSRSDKDAAEKEAEDLRGSITILQAKVLALKDELDRQYKENIDASDRSLGLQSQLEAVQRHSQESKIALESDLASVRSALENVQNEYNDAQEQIRAQSQEILELQEKREDADSKISDLEFEVAKLGDRLAIARQEKDRIRSETQAAEERFKLRENELHEECNALRLSIAELSEVVEAQKLVVSNKEENEGALVAKLEKSRAYSRRMETLREEAVSQLAEASRVLAAQKGVIKVQEARAAEAERFADARTAQLKELQEALKKMEESSAANGDLRIAQLEEMNKKRVQLEEERQTARAEADALRDEVRQATRRANELERTNKSLQSRIEDLKDTASATKAQLREARHAWTESETLSRALENELETKKMEIDHLRAKLQIAGAGLARLKSDRLLLQEQALQAEMKVASSKDTGSIEREIAQLQSQLSTKASQLSSATASLRAHKKIVADMKTTEQQLVIFIEDIILRAAATFRDLSNLSQDLQQLSMRHNPCHDLRALDLAADHGTPTKTMEEASCCLRTFVSLVQQASVELEDKKHKLFEWKQQTPHHATTPRTISPGSSLTPNDSSVIRAFRKMKDVLDAQFTGTDNQVDHVIRSLEGQIDALLTELNSANEALRSKDKLFADLEQERKQLRQKLSSMQSSVQNLELGQQGPEQRMLASIQEEEELVTNPKFAAGRMICRFLENKARSEKASALRKWSCAAAAMKSQEKSQHTAAALAHQLESTREKLILLKSQVKKRNIQQPQQQTNN